MKISKKVWLNAEANLIEGKALSFSLNYAF